MANQSDHHLETGSAAYIDGDERARLGGAFMGIGVLATLVVLAFYLFNAI